MWNYLCEKISFMYFLDLILKCFYDLAINLSNILLPIKVGPFLKSPWNEVLKNDVIFYCTCIGNQEKNKQKSDTVFWDTLYETVEL